MVDPGYAKIRITWFKIVFKKWENYNISYHLILSTHNDCKDFYMPEDNGSLLSSFPLKL
jgi:hypothetical protein